MRAAWWSVRRGGACGVVERAVCRSGRRCYSLVLVMHAAHAASLSLRSHQLMSLSVLAVHPLLLLSRVTAAVVLATVQHASDLQS
jgi:hypothetical protein